MQPQQKVCPHCWNPVPQQAAICPQCGAAVPAMQPGPAQYQNAPAPQRGGASVMPIALGFCCGLPALGLVGLVVLATIGASTSRHPYDSGTASGAFPSSPAPVSSAPTKPDLEVLDSNWKTEGYSIFIVGTVKNNTSRTYGYAQVELNLYDKKGNQVGSTLANVNNLEPNGKWKFKAFVLENNVDTFQIKNVSGF